MKQPVFVYTNRILFILCSLFIIALFTACQGVASTSPTNSASLGNGSNAIVTLIGSVQSVNASAHSATLLVNNQQVTVTGLSDQEISDLQAHLQKTYTIQATLNGNVYTIATGTTPRETDNAVAGITPAATTNPGATTGVNEPGSIDFIGKVQSMNANSIVVSLPNGDPLTMGITAQTDRSDLVNGQATPGQFIKAKALANTVDGSFLASKLGATDLKDTQDPTKLNAVDIAGVTTSAVGADNVLHLRVGSKGFDFTLAPTTQMKDFVSAQAIPTNQPVKVSVLYSGTTANVLKVENSNS